MERTYLCKQSGPTIVWLTDDPAEVQAIVKDRLGSFVHHQVMLKGHQFDLIISADDISGLKDDVDASIDFAREFMTKDSNEIMDWARVLLL